MPAFRPSGQKQIVPSPDGQPVGERRGSRRGKQLINQKGIARYDDLLTARFLEQTPTVSLPMNTAIKQARSVPISIEATVENPTTTHEMMADRILEFIDGGFNSNNETWDELLGLLLNDSLSIDTAPLEFVPTADTIEHPQTGEQMHWLSEVWFVDGSIVSKNLDAKDRLPMPPEPAYFKWGNVPNAHSRILSQFRDSDLFDQFTLVRLQRSARRSSVPMTRDEMAILETNRQPPELSAYGRGVVQQVRPWAEILMNQDRANVRHFADDEFAKGILNIGEQYAGEIETFREYWDDEVMGQTDHSLPKIASSNVEFIPFNESLKELQYLESQTWYSKLVWMLFGEATSTVGLAEDANYSTVEGQKEDVFVHTTVPRLNAIEEFLNNHWLPKMREYWIADAELEFRFKIEEHPIMADAERQKRRDDLNNGLTTPNRVLESEDRDPVPWGDVPSAAVSAFAREHPEWVMEHWGGIENVPEPASESGGLFDYTPNKARSESESKDLITSETTEPATPDEHDSAAVKDPDGEFSADVFRIVAGDDHEMFDEGTVLALGVDFPNSDVYVDWKIDEWPDDSQLSGAHVSIYATIDDAQAVAQGEIEMLDSLDAAAAKTVQNALATKYGVANGPTDLKSALKDPLRNERAPELPDLKHIVDATTEDLARVIREGFEDVEKELEKRWPDDGEKGTAPDAQKALAIDFDSILDTLSIRNALSSVVMEGVRQSMQESAETEAGNLMSRIEDDLDDPDASLIASFNVEDTLAFEQMQQFAAQDMVTVESTVKEQVRTELVEAAEDGTGVQGATERLRSKVDEVSDNHARLVARTETLQASRHGQQALQESSDAIAGKQWRATQDSRVRPWHEAMDGEIVPVDESFTVPGGWSGEPHYQPSDYPREAFVVGEDQSPNCRCSQESILKDEMPESAMEARDSELIEVRFIDAHRGDSPFVLEFDLSERQFEVREENKESPDEDFATVWKRVRSELSRTKTASELGVSKPTVGKWDEQVGV